MFCNLNDTTCFSVFEREREERDWGKLALFFGDEIEKEYLGQEGAILTVAAGMIFYATKSVWKTTVWQFWE